MRFTVGYDVVGTPGRVVLWVWDNEPRIPETAPRCLLRCGASKDTPSRLFRFLGEATLSLQLAEMDGVEGVENFVLTEFQRLEDENGRINERTTD